MDRLRRPPPDFRRAEVVAVDRRTPRLVRLTLAGDDLVGFDAPEPAASLRLLLPREGPGTPLELPSWNGNEFRFADDARPPIRTLTPLSPDPEHGRVEVEVVLHGDGALSRWAEAEPLGDEVAVSGPGRGFVPDPEVARLLLVGDESAVPAVGQLLEWLPPAVHVDVVLEVVDDDAEPSLPGRDGTEVVRCVAAPDDPPGAAMLAAMQEQPLIDDVVVWAAGEAAAVQKLRKLLGERGVPRSRTVVRGYWKHGRAGAGS
ncbi:siderophore-interacting protein [Actinomarinicola tropica]|uniref:siderophore-interacting protein n=1 Tax=Actinomarinicola tropica TaxID=2789776 RepID=UPI00189C3D51|nr:siderophore-interacting protein [Actinomarinicola tropica]